nr:Pentatricopeptide repeat-containing protein [Ipomoea batatas]
MADTRKASRRRASADDAAMVKAAAWAWYQHGSGSERPLGELLRLERTEKVQKPSRYKLEAIREVEEGKRKPTHHQRSSSTIPMSSSPSISSLLDKYEIQRISLQLDRYIENGHDDYCYGVLGNTNDRRRVASLSESGTTETKKPPAASLKGFWLRHAAVCGSSSADVVETGSIIGRSSRWPPRGKRWRNELKEAHLVFNDIGKWGIKPSDVSFNTLNNGYCRLGDLDAGFRLKSVMEDNGLVPDAYTYTALINGLCKKCSMGFADDLFEEMCEREKGMVENGIVLDGVTYTSFITGLCRQGRVSVAERMLRETLGAGIKPDDATYTMVIDAICKNGDVKMGYTSDLQLQKILDALPYPRVCLATIGFSEAHSASDQVKLHPEILLMEVSDNVAGHSERFGPSDAQTMDPTFDVVGYPVSVDQEVKPVFEFEGHVAYQPSDLRRAGVEAHAQGSGEDVVFLQFGAGEADDLFPDLVGVEVGGAALGLGEREEVDVLEGRGIGVPAEVESSGGVYSPAGDALPDGDAEEQRKTRTETGQTPPWAAVSGELSCGTESTTAGSPCPTPSVDSAAASRWGA